MGLGPYPKVSLADTRTKVKLLTADVERGIDPIAERQAKRRKNASAEKPMTFAEAESAYIDAKVDVDEGGFKNPKHRQ